MTLGEFIKNKRTELGMSRNLLATKTGISHTEVQRIETVPIFLSMIDFSSSIDFSASPIIIQV